MHMSTIRFVGLGNNWLMLFTGAGLRHSLSWEVERKVLKNLYGLKILRLIWTWIIIYP